MSAMRTYKMPIRSIRSAGMRDRLDWSRVALYRQMLRDGRRPPPVQLLHRLGDGRWQLGDGAHRMMAARLEGKKQVEAIKLICGGDEVDIVSANP